MCAAKVPINECFMSQQQPKQVVVLNKRKFECAQNFVLVIIKTHCQFQIFGQIYLKSNSILISIKYLYYSVVLQFSVNEYFFHFQVPTFPSSFCLSASPSASGPLSALVSCSSWSRPSRRTSTSWGQRGRSQQSHSICQRRRLVRNAIRINCLLVIISTQFSQIEIS